MPKTIIRKPMTRITGPIIFKCPPHSCLDRNLSRSSPNSLGRYEIAVKTQPIRINMNAIIMRIMLQLAEINRPPIVIPTPAPSSLDSILKEEDFFRNDTRLHARTFIRQAFLLALIFWIKFPILVHCDMAVRVHCVHIR